MSAITDRNITLPKSKLIEFCERNHVRKLSFFGSVLRNDFREDSDVDVLVEFEPGQHPGLRFFDMQSELADLFNRKIDLRTPAELSKYIRNRVLAEAEIQYVHR